MMIKRSIQVLALVVMTMAVAGAQTIADQPVQSPPKDRVENMTNRMAKKLELSEQQKKDVKVVLAKAHADRKEHREKMHKMRKEQEAQIDAQMKAILTPEQFEKYSKGKLKRKQKRKRKAMKRGRHEERK